MSGLIGQHIGQYEIIAMIGRGGMAAVYQAHQESMGRDVAIKVIKPDLAETGDFIKRFQREVRTVASLSHPHILKVFDYGQFGEVVYLVMELLRGGSLADLIRKGPLSAAQTLQILEQIGSALDHAHRLGIIHRDLKPQNVMLDNEGNAFLTDFGIAKILSETTVLTQTGAAMGTPAYMPPEQWQGIPLDARADIYALGVMLFEMLAGKLPFSADTPFQMMHMHVSETPPPLSNFRRDLPPGIEAVIAKALAKNREERFASASEVTNAFRAALAGQMPVPPTSRPRRPSDTATIIEPASSATTGQAGRPTAPNRGRMGLAIGIAAVVLIGIAAAVFALLSAQSGPNPGLTPTAQVFAPSLIPTTVTAMPVTNEAATATSQSSPIFTTNAVTAVMVLPSATGIPPTVTNIPLTALTVSPTFTATPLPATATVTLTASSTSTLTPTPTITLTPSPNLEARAAGTFAARATLTANAVASFTATATPNEDATIQAIVAATDTAVAISLFTNTPAPTLIPISTSTSLPTTLPTLVASPVPPTALPTLVTTVAPTVVNNPQPAGLIAFASKRGAKYQLYTVDAAGASETRLAQSVADDFGPSLATDGIRIAFTSNRNGTNKIYVVNADNSANVRQLTSGKGDDYAPAWSPDGLHIVFHTNRDGNWELYMMDASDGSHLRRLTNNPADDTDATWSPDGTQIAFHSSRDGTNGIWVMQSDGSNVHRLSPPTIDAHDPAWSPDGQLMVFASFKNKKPSLYLMNADGSNVHPLLKNAIEEDQAAWSPDSQFIVFRTKRNGQVSIYMVDVNGNPVRSLTSAGADNQFPTWQGRASGG